MTDKYAALKNKQPYQRPRKGQPNQPVDWQPKTEEELAILRERIREDKEKGKKPAKRHKLATIKFHLNISAHDLEIKHRKIREELGKGNQVKISLSLQGRERSRPQIGVAWLNKQVEPHSDYSTFNKPATADNLNIVLFPAGKQKNKPSAQKAPLPPNQQ